MLETELKACLSKAFADAMQQHHLSFGTEHLRLALLDDSRTAEVLEACSASIENMRQSLSIFIKRDTPKVAGFIGTDTFPTMPFNRVIGRAIKRVGGTGLQKEATGTDVLWSLLHETDSHAVQYLHQQGVTITRVWEVINGQRT